MRTFADITGYNISLWIHISAAVVGLGATFAEAILFQVAMRMDPRNMPFVHRAQRAINQRLANPALLIILITGIIQVLDSDFIDFSDAWISASFVIIIALGGLLGAYFIPTDKRLEAQAAEEIAAAGPGPVQLSQGYLDKLKQEGMMGVISGVLIIVVIFLMVVKPGA
jgi:uncharacterized membrane protein